METQVSFLVSGVTFVVDPSVLMSHSHYFQALLSGRFQESAKEIIEIKGVCAGEFSCLLKFLEDAEGQKDLTSSSRLYQLPKVFRLADRFCMDRFLRYLKKALMLSWFKVSETDHLITMAEQLGLKDDMITMMAKDFIPHLDPHNGFPRLPKECFTITVLSVLLNSETFWQYAFTSISDGYFQFMDRVLTFVLGKFLSKDSVCGPTVLEKFQELAGKTRPETLSFENVNHIVGNIDITRTLKTTFWHEYSKRTKHCQTRIRRLFKHARCILSSLSNSRLHYQTVLDVQNWSWKPPTLKKICCDNKLTYQYHNSQTEFCDSNCVIRFVEKAICSTSESYSHAYVGCSSIESQNIWLVATVPGESSKPVFQYQRISKKLQELTNLENFRVVHALVNGADGVFYIVAEPSQQYGLVCIFRFRESDCDLSLLASVNVYSLLVDCKLSAEERLLKRESRVFLAGQALHIFLLVPSYHTNDTTKKQFHLFSGVIDIANCGPHLELHKVISYNFTRQRDSNWSEKWCVFRKGNRIVLVLSHESLFLMQYSIASETFRHLGFLPNIPPDYDVRSFSPISLLLQPVLLH